MTLAQLKALRVLELSGRKAAEGTRGGSEAARMPWMRSVVNTRAAKALVAAGLARTWEARPDGTVVRGADLAHLIGKYRTQFGITDAGRRASAKGGAK